MAATVAKIKTSLTAAINISGGRDMLNTKLVSWALGIFTAISFVVCVIYGLVTPLKMTTEAAR